MLILYPSFRRLATTFSLHLSAACGGTSPPGEAPLEGETGEAPPAAEKASRFQEAARLAGPPGTGNRFAATVRLSAKLTGRCLGSIKKKPLCQRGGTPFITLPMYPAE